MTATRDESGFLPIEEIERLLRKMKPQDAERLARKWRVEKRLELEQKAAQSSAAFPE